MKKLILFSICMLLLWAGIKAQERYLDEIFSEVSVSSNLQYGVNLSVLTGAPVLDTLRLDLYEPAGDTLSLRPLILICHTGNFLPPILNGAPFGSKTDSANVELATRLAKMGYVVASYQYRTGWNPLPTASDEVRRSTLLQASYRGFQDTRTAIRFFRMTEAEMSNPYRVDVNKIAVGGIGTGGYCALGAAYLDSLSEIQLQKFIDLSDPNMPVPYVVPEIHGNFDATDTTLLSIGNHAGYSSDFNVVFHMGGALGDSIWIQPGGIPSISIHGIEDPYAPYYIGNVIVPTTGDIVIPRAAGGGKIAEMNNRNGNNQIFIDAGFDDEITQIANARNNNLEGLYAFNIPEPPADTQCITSIPGAPISESEFNSGPWSWYNEEVYIASWNIFFQNAIDAGETITGEEENCAELLLSSPNMGSVARAYIDTCIQYLKPRLLLALDSSADTTTTSIDDKILNSRLSIYPNPTEGNLTIQLKANDNVLEAISLYDLTGRLVIEGSSLQTNVYSIDTSPLTPGVYMANIRARKGMIMKRVIIK